MIMTKKQKIKDKFLNNPTSINLSVIIYFLENEGYELRTWNGGSHQKLRHLKTWKSIPLPIHHNEVAPVYKRLIKKFYLKNLEQNDKQ